MAFKEVLMRKEESFASVVKAGDFFFVSGQDGTVDTEGNPVEGIEAQTRQCLENITQVLAQAGVSLCNVIKVQVFLTKAGDFHKMDEVYSNYFTEVFKEYFNLEDRPARTTVVTSLVKRDALIEMDCIAYEWHSPFK